MIVIRSRKAQLGCTSDAKSHPSLGAINGTLPLVAGDEETVLSLEAALGHDDAGFGNCRPIGGDGLAAIRLALAVKKSHSSQNANQPRSRVQRCKASAMGPSAKTGRKLSAPTNKIVPRTKAPKVTESLGRLPEVVGQRR